MTRANKTPVALRMTVVLLAASAILGISYFSLANHGTSREAETQGRIASLNVPPPTSEKRTLPAIPATPRNIELPLNNILLKPRHNLDAVLGEPHRTTVDDCDPRDVGFAYPDGSYICVHKGIVVLVSYNIKARVANPAEALEAVGLYQSEEPIQPYPKVQLFVWLGKRGNALRLNRTVIPLVNLILGDEPSIFVDMTDSNQ